MGRKSGWSSQDLADQTGRVALVTGANSGVGFETARALALKGAQVILACRDGTRGEAAAAAIRAEQPAAIVSFSRLDLADLASIRACAAEFKERYERLDMLINNAGIMAVPRRTTTADGFEMHFGTNHLGHFALTGLLIDRLLMTPGARVVTVSSALASVGRLDFGDLNWERSYQSWRAYGRSKLANLMFSLELGRQLSASGAGVLSVAAMPGYAATNLQYRGPGISRQSLYGRLVGLGNRLLAQSAADGALPSLYAACAAGVQSGDYYVPERLFHARGAPVRIAPGARARDPETAGRLWQVSVEMTGVDFQPLLPA